MGEKELLKSVISRNNEYSKEQLEFRPYCLKRMEQRNIQKEAVIELLSINKGLTSVEIQEKSYQGAVEQRYKLIYQLSGRYKMIIIISYCERVLKVINVIKTSKDWEKLWRKRVF